MYKKIFIVFSVFVLSFMFVSTLKSFDSQTVFASEVTGTLSSVGSVKTVVKSVTKAVAQPAPAKVAPTIVRYAVSPYVVAPKSVTTVQPAAPTPVPAAPKIQPVVTPIPAPTPVTTTSSAGKVTQVSNNFPGIGSSLIYSQNGLWNADGTEYLHDIGSDGTVVVINPTTGATIAGNLPFTTASNPQFDPVNPDTIYYFSGNSLMQYSVKSAQKSVVKTFDGALGSLGGSVDYTDRTGRYFILNIGGAIRVWDKQTGALFAGSIPATLVTNSGGWAGISPDGKYVIVNSGWNHLSYAVNQSNQTLATNGTLFWAMSGDHGDIVSTSDGKTYEITANSYDQSEVWRVDVSQAKFPAGTMFSGTPTLSADQIATEKQGNVKLLSMTWSDSAHFSCASTADYCFVSTESSTGGNIYRIDMDAPYTVQDLTATHSTDSSYTAEPRVDSSWDGSKAMFASDFGKTGGNAGYSDIYSVTAQ